jgi:hypothetical protein
MGIPVFHKQTIAEVNNDLPPSPMNTFHAVGDLNGDGRPDVAISGRDGWLVWLENAPPGSPWTVHLVDEVAAMECGGTVVDLTGNGWGDIINGGDWRSSEVSWWENPGPAGGKWRRRVLADTGRTKIHDTIVGEVKDDGQRYLVFANQGSGTSVYCVPLPADPTVCPWPNLQLVAAGKIEPNPYSNDGFLPEEGLAIGDLDGDGRNELVCGTHWYRRTAAGWEGHKFAGGYLCTKVAIGDVDGDGRNEILLSEGDPCIFGKTQGGKVAWFKPGLDLTAPWEEHVLEDFLLDAHSLQVGDICGNGQLDVLVGEVGVADPRTDDYTGQPPRLIVYENDGTGAFTRHVVDEGTGTHDARLVDVRGLGVLDIVGKPLHGPEKWHVHVWYNGRAR